MTTGNGTTRPNFFILLDLNPNAPWSQAVFEKTLIDKQGRWSRDSSSGVGQRSLLAQGYLRLIPEIKRVMNDPTLRGAEAIAARIELEEQKRKRQAAFEGQLPFINAKSSIEQAELDKFIDTFKDILTAQEIKDRVTVPIGAHGGPSLPPQLDPVTAKNIADRLSVIHMSSLYQLLLGVELKKTSADELCRLADQLFLDTVRRSHTEEDTAKKELAGYAKDIFKSEEMREKYDETLRQESLNRLLRKLDEIMSHALEKEIHVGQVTLFLEDAQRAGWQPEEALMRLQEHKRLRKWSIEVPAIDPKAQKICCGKCKHLNEKTQSFCSACRESLFFDCPDCGRKDSCESIACGQCSFPVGNRYRVNMLLEEIVALLKKGDFAGADKFVQEAETTWQPQKPDALAQKMREFRTRIDAEQQKGAQRQKEVSEQCIILISQKQLFAARDLLLSAKDVAFPDREVYKRTVDDAIAQAQALIKRARAAGMSIDERIDLYRQALLLCSDCKEARDLLKTTPPSPPQNLRARVKGKVVGLSWDPSPTQGVTYHIIRKSRAQPNSEKDGKILDDITGYTYDDATAEVGLPLYYAVYAECEQVLSQQGALLARSILLTQDVWHAVAKVDDHRVDLSWEPPPNASTICIVRKEQKPPVSLKDGTLLAELDRNQKRFLDQKVENERVYHYAIYCQFRDQEGHLVTSPGTYMMAFPETPPGPITQIDFNETKTAQASEILISWKRPKKGNVIILKSDHPPTFHVGDVIAESELSQYGRRLEDRPESVKELWTGSGVAYYTPIVLVQKWAYVGTTRRYACVDNVGNLRCQNLGSAVRLQWSWPEQCQEVIVSFSPQDWPQPHDPMTTTRRVSRATYDQFGYHDIKGSVNQDYYITVSAVIKYGSEYIPAQELRTMGRIVSKVVFHYEIKGPTFFHKKHTLHIAPRTSGALPALLLVGKRDHLPMSRTDGDLLYRVEPMIVNEERVIVVELPTKVFSPNTFGKLFLEDDQSYEVVTIHHPSAQNLRLS